MSRIIGHSPAGAGASVQGFAGQRPAPPPDAVSRDAEDPETNAENAAAPRVAAVAADRIALLEREIAALSAELEAHATRQEQLQQQAFEKGRAVGSQQTREDVERRNEAVRAGIARAAASYVEAHGRTEALALQLASAAVERVLGEAGDMHDRLRRVIATSLARLAGERPQVVRLSRRDFPDQAALATLAADWPDLRIEADPALAAGDCVLQLELGERDIGLPGQLERLRAFFGEAANAALSAPADGVRA